MLIGIIFYCAGFCLYYIVLLSLCCVVLCCVVLCCAVFVFYAIYCVDKFYIHSYKANLTESVKQIHKFNLI
jgi:1,4-dihydroxy-2-naphthoate octaprenyltransferase